jgi:RNA polymerase sigma-70 factor, ECF subfamily
LTEEHLRSLLARGLIGDEPAYRTFLAELATHLRSWLRGRLARLPEEIEDLLQEILLAVHNQRHTFDPKQPLKPWVHAIARYKIIDLLRRRSRNEMLNDPLDDEDQLFVGVNGDAAEARYDLAKLLDELPDRQTTLRGRRPGGVTSHRTVNLVRCSMPIGLFRTLPHANCCVIKIYWHPTNSKQRHVQAADGFLGLG